MYSSTVKLKRMAILTGMLLIAVIAAFLYFGLKANEAKDSQWVYVNKQMEEAIEQFSPASMQPSLERKVVSKNTPIPKTKEASLDPGKEAAFAPIMKKAPALPEDKRSPPHPNSTNNGTAPKNEASSAADQLININQASVAELDDLPGIGPSKAKAIVNYRQTIGGFKTLAQLMDVKGIGPKIFEKLRGKITIQ